ncbi:MAG: substrate-binding periplasmic protein, partial [Planctomycetaceae bacterium]
MSRARNGSHEFLIGESLDLTPTRRLGGTLLGRLALLSVLTLAGCGAETSLQSASPLLVWGGDREGGAPFIFAHPDDDTRLTGFEVDLAGRLAELLGRPGDRFQQCQWDQVLMVLSRGDVEIALNGYEYTPRRAAEYRTSLPYYIYQLSLATRRADATLTDWESLAVPPRGGGRHRVGVLAGS